MNRAKIFIAFTFLLGFAVCISAQSVQFSNEIKEYQLYGHGKLKDIELKVSTRETVKSVLGDDCDFKTCDYDDNWEMIFVYLDEHNFRYKTKGNVEQKLIPAPEYLGRLLTIIFTPKEDISFREINFSNKFTKEGKTAIHSGLDLLIYSDSEGLYYSVINDDIDKGIHKGNIYGITYRIPEKLEQNLFILVQEQDKPFSDL